MSTNINAINKKRKRPRRYEKNAENAVDNNHLVPEVAPPQSSNDPSAADDDRDLDLDEPVPPLHVFFDVENMQVEGRHVPNLIEAETETEDDFFERYGDDCIPAFLEWLDSLTNNGKRPLTVIAHNIIKNASWSKSATAVKFFN